MLPYQLLSQTLLLVRTVYLLVNTIPSGDTDTLSCSPLNTSGSTMAMAMSGEHPPAWFLQFMNEMREANSRHITSINMTYQAIHNINVRLAALEKAFTEGLARNVEAVKAVRSDLCDLSRNLAQPDSCKVLISGIPLDPRLEDNTAIDNIFEALSLSHVRPFIFETRKWEYASTQLNDATKNAENSARAHLPSFRSIVVKFSSNCIRDAVLSKCFKLASTDCNSLFGCGGSMNVSIRPLWPKPVYNLWRLAMEAHRKHKYAKPVVRNHSVFMHETLESPLIPIFTDRDLENLPSRQSQPCFDERRQTKLVSHTAY